MLKTRPPRVGDACLAKTGVVTLPGGVQWGQAEIVDVSADGRSLRLAFGDSKDKMRQTSEVEVGSYGADWKYQDDRRGEGLGLQPQWNCSSSEGVGLGQTANCTGLK